MNRIEIALIDELSNVKIQSEGFQKLAKITELRFLQKGYIPHLLHHVQQKVSAQTKNIKSGKVVTEYNGLLFAANHFLNADISLAPDITLFFCHQYKDRILPSPSADEIKDIQYLKGTLSFSTGKRPSDYVTEILKGLREKLQIFRENGEHEHIVEYEAMLQRFEDSQYVEHLILKIQLQK